jgi:hypothetical protein
VLKISTKRFAYATMLPITHLSRLSDLTGVEFPDVIAALESSVFMEAKPCQRILMTCNEGTNLHMIEDTQ